MSASLQADLAAIAYLISGVLFIMALRGLSSPVTSRAGNRNGMIGMALAVDTSSLYSRNLFNFVSLIIDKKSGALALNWDDDIVKGAGLARDGEIVHPSLKG